MSAEAETEREAEAEAEAEPEAGAEAEAETESETDPRRCWDDHHGGEHGDGGCAQRADVGRPPARETARWRRTRELPRYDVGSGSIPGPRSSLCCRGFIASERRGVHRGG